VPPTLALCLGVGAVILGIVLLATDSLVAGAIWLLAGLSLLALGVESARRWPASALLRFLLRVTRATGRHLDVARVSAGAWSGASRQRIALRREQRGLRKRRDGEMAALGSAAYREEAEEMRVLREQIAELDREIERCEQTMGEVVEHARERVQRKRVEAQPTQ
jgi:hypothetical protein